MAKCFEAKAERHGASAGQRFEVIPAGVSGWGTDQQLLWFCKYGVAYQPDLVLLAFFPGNDFENNAEALGPANMGRVMKPFFRLENGELALSYYPFDPAQGPPVTGSGDREQLHRYRQPARHGTSQVAPAALRPGSLDHAHACNGNAGPEPQAGLSGG